MADRDDLVARIRRLVGDVRGARFDSNELIIPTINSAIKELSHITQKYNTINSSFTFTAPGPMNLPSDFIGLNRIRNSDSNPIWRIDFRQIKDWNTGTSASPSFYALKAKKLYLVPTPSANQTLELDYIATAPSLALGTDEPATELGPFSEAYIVAYVCRELSIAGQDFEAAQMYSGQVGSEEMKSRDWANTEEMFEGHHVFFDGATDDSYGRHSWLI